MSALALLVLMCAGLWLIYAGWLMLARPARALAMLGKTAATFRVNISEQGLRLLAGIALVVRAPDSKWPDGFTYGGWFVVITSIMLLIIPLRWHAGYASWWAERIPQPMVRCVGPVSAVLGLALIHASL